MDKITDPKGYVPIHYVKKEEAPVAEVIAVHEEQSNQHKKPRKFMRSTSILKDDNSPPKK